MMKYTNLTQFILLICSLFVLSFHPAEAKGYGGAICGGGLVNMHGRCVRCGGEEDPVCGAGDKCNGGLEPDPIDGTTCIKRPGCSGKKNGDSCHDAGVPSGHCCAHSCYPGEMSCMTGSGKLTARKNSNNVIVGSHKADTMTGGSSSDIILGRNGDDIIHGGDGDDTLDGGAGDDVIYGGGGHDVISGGPGADTVYGGPGDDKLVLRGAGDPGDKFLGGPGNDRIVNKHGRVMCDEATTCNERKAGFMCPQPQTPTCHLDDHGEAVCACGMLCDEHEVLVDGWQCVRCGIEKGDPKCYDEPKCADGHTIQDSHCVPCGEEGDPVCEGEKPCMEGFMPDEINGTHCVDEPVEKPGCGGKHNNDPCYDREVATGVCCAGVCYKGPSTCFVGDRKITGKPHSNNIIIGRHRDDVLTGGSAADTILGRHGDDIIDGGDGDDNLRGGSGDDLIYGGDGQDVIEGGPGADKMFGGAGDDVLILRGDPDVGDTFMGGPGDDRIINNRGVDLCNEHTTCNVRKSGLSCRAPETPTCQLDDHGAAICACGRVCGDHEVLVDDWKCERCGVEKDDPPCDDPVLECPGNHVLVDGQCSACGTEGSPLCELGHSCNKGLEPDDIDGSTCVVSSGCSDKRNNDACTDGLGSSGICCAGACHAAHSKCVVGNGNMAGTHRDDVIMGSPKADVVNSGPGSDSIWGKGGDDVIHGGGGDDRIDGGPGDDVLYGGDGQDVLSGGPGSDIVYGGSGDDVLILKGASDPGDQFMGGPGRDKIINGHGKVLCNEATHCNVENAGISCHAPEQPTCQLDEHGAAMCACGRVCKKHEVLVEDWKCERCGMKAGDPVCDDDVKCSNGLTPDDKTETCVTKPKPKCGLVNKPTCPDGTCGRGLVPGRRAGASTPVRCLACGSDNRQKGYFKRDCGYNRLLGARTASQCYTRCEKAGYHACVWQRHPGPGKCFGINRSTKSACRVIRHPWYQHWYTCPK